MKRTVIALVCAFSAAVCMVYVGCRAVSDNTDMPVSAEGASENRISGMIFRYPSAAGNETDAPDAAERSFDEKSGSLLDYSRDAVLTEYPEYRNVDWNNFIDLEQSRGTGGKAGEETYHTRIRYRYTLFGIATGETVEVRLETKDRENYDIVYCRANNAGLISKFEPLADEAEFDRAKEAVIADFEQNLAACKTDGEKSALWLTICDNPKGTEDIGSMLRWEAIDDKLILQLGLNPEYSCEIVG